MHAAPAARPPCFPDALHAAMCIAQYGACFDNHMSVAHFQARFNGINGHSRRGPFILPLFDAFSFPLPPTSPAHSFYTKILDPLSPLPDVSAILQTGWIGKDDLAALMMGICWALRSSFNALGDANGYAATHAPVDFVPWVRALFLLEASGAQRAVDSLWRGPTNRQIVTSFTEVAAAIAFIRYFLGTVTSAATERRDSYLRYQVEDTSGAVDPRYTVWNLILDSVIPYCVASLASALGSGRQDVSTNLKFGLSAQGYGLF